MKFVRNTGGEMILETGIGVLQEMKRVAPLSTSLIVDIPEMKKSVKEKSKNFLTNKSFAFAPVLMFAGGIGDNGGIFWNTFLQYIFPWMLDIAKVYCLVRIAQAFYQEKRGGRDGGTGFSALIEHGKWYLVFWCLPILVDLIDGVGHQMFNELHSGDNITDIPTLKK